MASRTQVYNAIAAACGSGTRVTDPDDDTTIARAIKAVWDLNRRAALREGAWNFAIARRRLPALDEAPEWGFDMGFQLPAGTLRLIEVQSAGAQLSITFFVLESHLALGSCAINASTPCFVGPIMLPFSTLRLSVLPTATPLQPPIASR